MSWEKVRLGDVVEFNPKIKLEKDLMYECIEMEHIKSGFKFAYPGKIKIGNSSGSKFQNGDTLFARITPCLENGKIAEVKGLTNDVGIGSTEFFVLRNIQDKTDQKFVFYLALTDLIRGTAEKSMQGASGRQRAIKETVENLYLKLPPLPIQKRIADILSAYDNLIENNLQRIRHLEAMAKCEYKMLMNESEVEEKSINEIAETFGGGTPSTKDESLWENGEIEWYSPTDITKTKSLVILKSEKKINSKGLQQSSAKLFPPYTLMMTSRATIGFISITDKFACTNQGFINIIPKDEIHRFIILFNLKERRDELIGLSSGSTFLEIPKSVFRNLTIEIPKSKSKVAEFHTSIQTKVELLITITKQNTHLRQIRDTLLPKLMSGQIDVSQTIRQAKVVEMPLPKNKGEKKKDSTDKPKAGAKYYYRTVLASYIVNKLWQENTFGHVKLMKLMYLCEHLAEIETVSNYHRDAAGPYDPQMMRSVDKQMKEKKWFEMYKHEGKYPKYRPLQNYAEHQAEFLKYFVDKQVGIDSLIERFRKESTEKAEMVATIYEAWRGLKDNPENVTVENILDEVLNKWHDSKQRIPSERWIKCYEWMQEKGWVF